MNTDKAAIEAAESYCKSISDFCMNCVSCGKSHEEVYLAGATWAEARHGEELREARAQSRKLVDALNWIGAIECAPPISWPHYLTIAKHANEALALYSDNNGSNGRGEDGA